ncbi:bifunctional P-450/NADPH-P450 reductase [Cubamyces sp. BRFM 1775]|nr:bifunctional P-450/NADPH-P450 reductase [Cubamyces sp. BRFM 1775]
MTIPIPSPPAIPFLGHVNTIDRDLPVRSLVLLARQYGEIFQLSVFGQKRIFINSYELQNELSNEKRFFKKIDVNLNQVRNATGDGLFTARPDEQNWHLAHRLLMPCFSAANVYNMTDGMMDIISQLVLKWDRFGPKGLIDPSTDFTRLTLDAITLCAMSYRLNSFYREDLPPFAIAMADFLIESGKRANRPAIVQNMMTTTNAKYEEDKQTMMKLVEEIIEDHRANPPEKPDVLSVMLNGRDKETGLGLSDESIKHNLLTFLIAGHETTSGMLTFTVYYLLKNPEAMRKLREEIDTQIGDRPMSTRDVNKLPYLLAAMRESMRLGPTAPARSVAPLEDTVIGGKYFVEKGTFITINTMITQRGPKVWGEDAEQFRPERMLDGKWEALPQNAWQPFGFGMRGCIGRPFAWQEAQLVLVTILQHFDLVMHDSTYELELKQTLTIKPHNFFIHAIPRKNKPSLQSVLSLSQDKEKAVATQAASNASAPASDTAKLKPMYVLYGSNTGCSESFAQRIASEAPALGFRASIGTLDTAIDRYPKDGPVIVVTASYEGQPADNAAHFVEWLSNVQEPDAFKGIKYAVFGCGNRDWMKTYQRIPTLIDETVAAHGGTRLVPRGEGDAGGGDFFESFDKWMKMLSDVLLKEYQTTKNEEVAAMSVKFVSPGTARAEALRQKDAALGTVIENKLLTSPNAPAKRHIEFALPESMTYRAGDYLAVLPANSESIVRRALARFGLSAEQEIELSSAGPTSLPVNKPVAAYTILSGYVELSQPATTRDLKILLKAKSSETSTKALQELSEDYAEKVLKRRLSVLDILEENPDIDLPLATFLHMLPAMRIRQYSISSSPLWNPQHVTLTISVLEAPPIPGRTEPFCGVASTYLASLRPGNKVQLSVRASNVAFHPPADLSIPLIMICAGSGLAPMRGFIQERAMQKQAGREVAKSLLFFGCRYPKEDYLYSDEELKEWSELGVVDVRPAFSRSSADSEGCRYVQDRLHHDADDVVEAFSKGGKFFVCGSSKVSNGVKQVLVRFFKETKNLTDEEALATFDKVMNGRYTTDIFE